MDYNKIKDIENKQYLPVFSRWPVAFTYGKGIRLYDTLGNEYRDFFAGLAVNSLGYADEGLTKAIAEQAGRLIHVSNAYYNDVQSEFVDTLLSGTEFSRVFLSNSGAEANECAIKIVRKHFNSLGENRPLIVSCKNSFHGRTLATVTATGQDKYSRGFEPLPNGFKHIPYNDIAALKSALTNNVGALLLELIQGEGGVIKIDYEYATMAYTLCKAKGILLIIDEVQTGSGRTGKFFCYEHLGILPDIVTLAKGLGGGMPIGATLVRGNVSTALKAGDHGSTFGGNALSCAAAKEVVTRLRNGLLDHVAKAGEHLKNSLARLRGITAVVDTRGKGLLYGIELDSRVSNVEIARRLFAKKILVGTAGGNVIRISPPYIVTVEEIDGLISELAIVLEQASDALV